jgi:eukaryotic-like serine/threonine-protein kinase
VSSDVERPAGVLDGRYELEMVLGRGAMGEVWRAQDLRLGRAVAVKCLRLELAADPGVRARFEDEARAASRLSHPGIVTVFDTGEWHGVPYLVMECLPGRTLAEEMSAGAMPEARVRSVGRQVAEALAAAHAGWVSHRDVKPGNILLAEAGGVKLADFGIAKSAEGVDLTLIGTVVGSPAYMAPERLGGEPSGPASDLYSLGVVLYEAITGEKPYGGDTPVALAHAIHTATPVPITDRVSQVDAGLVAAIDKAMAKDPVHRHPSAYDLVADLTEAPAAMSSTRVDTTATAVMPTSGPPGPVPDEGHDPTVVGYTTSGPALEAPVADRAPSTLPRGSYGLAGLLRWWRRRTPRDRQIMVAIAAAVVAFVAVVVAVDTGDPSLTPATTTASTAVPAESLPEPLDEAITELEQSVQP